MALAARHGVPLVPQAGNTGMLTGTVPDGTGREVVVSLGRSTGSQVDGADHLVAEAGCSWRQYRRRPRVRGGCFRSSLGAEGSCQIGGNLSTNAGGINVLRYGMARDLVLGLEVVLADGRAGTACARCARTIPATT